jgi:hypothetical protein
MVMLRAVMKCLTAQDVYFVETVSFLLVAPTQPHLITMKVQKKTTDPVYQWLKDVLTLDQKTMTHEQIPIMDRVLHARNYVIFLCTTRGVMVGMVTFFL